ncbi:hypothetical protein AN958_05555 [Leucoagaricus sp. SymC.cos]|nr:hypothetical protein AN958_05555 [Leucoagaricus sp. SymC.cos]
MDIDNLEELYRINDDTSTADEDSDDESEEATTDEDRKELYNLLTPELLHLKKKGLCFLCKEGQHFARECPFKNDPKYQFRKNTKSPKKKSTTKSRKEKSSSKRGKPQKLGKHTIHNIEESSASEMENFQES